MNGINKINVLKQSTAKRLLAMNVTSNKDQITVSQNGDDWVLKFANEQRVFFIQNGFVACALVPMFRVPMPV